MATCSYQTLSRYDYDGDHQKRNYRARNLDDIRVNHREAAARTRLQFKCLKMFQNRPSLVDVLFDDDDDDDDHYSHSDSGYHDEIDGVSSSSSSSTGVPSSINDSVANNIWTCPTTSWEIPSTPWGSGEPNCRVPSVWPNDYSDDFSYEYHQTIRSISDIPESYLGDTSTFNDSSRDKITKPVPRDKRHLSLYKQTSGPTSPTRSHQSIFEESVKIQENFNNLMNSLKQCPQSAQNYSQLIENSWLILLNSIQDGHTGDAAIDLLKSLCTERLINPETLVILLQNGLTYSLKNAIHTLTSGTTIVCDLLLTMISAEPAIIPFLVEIFISSSLLDELNDRIISGDSSDSYAVINFYHQLSETILSNLNQPPQPILPQILLTTGVSQHTIDSYGPISTMQKYLTYQLIENLVKRCIDSRSDSTNSNLALQLLANIMNLAMYTIDCPKSSSWIFYTSLCLNALDIEKRIKTIINPSSQKKGKIHHEADNVSVQMFSQFLQFYYPRYNQLDAQLQQQLVANKYNVS